MTLLATEDLSIGYGSTAIARGIGLTLQAGSVTCLLGPNGVGKTTLFRTLLGLIAPVGGTIRIDGQALADLSRAAVARRIAYVPQSYRGDFAYSLLDLVVMGRTAYLGPFATPTRADLDIAMDALASLGIADLASKDANRVSGGQRQLALIARALAQRSRLVVMDEPTASLDFGNRLRVLDRIRSLSAQGLSVLVSTHEPEHAFAIADHVAILGRHGRFAFGAPGVLLTSERLSDLYAVALQVERTPSGRRVVGAVRPCASPAGP